MKEFFKKKDTRKAHAKEESLWTKKREKKKTRRPTTFLSYHQRPQTTYYTKRRDRVTLARSAVSSDAAFLASGFRLFFEAKETCFGEKRRLSSRESTRIIIAKLLKSLLFEEGKKGALEREETGIVCARASKRPF